MSSDRVQRSAFRTCSSSMEYGKSSSEADRWTIIGTIFVVPHDVWGCDNFTPIHFPDTAEERLLLYAAFINDLSP